MILLYKRSFCGRIWAQKLYGADLIEDDRSKIIEPLILLAFEDEELSIDQLVQKYPHPRGIKVGDIHAADSQVKPRTTNNNLLSSGSGIGNPAFT